MAAAAAAGPPPEKKARRSDPTDGYAALRVKLMQNTPLDWDCINLVVDYVDPCRTEVFYGVLGVALGYPIARKQLTHRWSLRVDEDEPHDDRVRIFYKTDIYCELCDKQMTIKTVLG